MPRSDAKHRDATSSALRTRAPPRDAPADTWREYPTTRRSRRASQVSLLTGIERVMASSTTLSLAPADYAGWRVCSADGQLGFVERLQLDGATGEPTFLAVRAGRIIVLLVPVEEVDTVDADACLIVLGPNSSRLVPELDGDELVLRPRDEPAPLAAAV